MILIDGLTPRDDPQRVAGEECRVKRRQHGVSMTDMAIALVSGEYKSLCHEASFLILVEEGKMHVLEPRSTFI